MTQILPMRCRYLCLLLVFVIVGCTPKRTSTIGPGHTYRPGEQEARLYQAGEEMSRDLRAQGGLYPDAQLQAYVQSVMDRLLGHDLSAYRPLTARVYIIDSPIVNAFCLPNGDVFVHTGALGRMRNEAQLAMLLGHEITHATHRHAFQAYEDAYVRTGAHTYIALLGSLGGDFSAAISGLSAVITVAAITGYSRERESEADRVGLALMARAGYDPRQGRAMFQRMLDATDKKDRRWNFLYATHPKMKARVTSCATLAEKLPPEVLAKARDLGQDRYLAAATPLIYQEARKHIAQGKFSLALETLAFMQMVRPTDPRAPALLGDLYRARHLPDDRGRAEDAYRRALRLRADFAPAHRGLGFVCLEQGNRTEARMHLARYLELSPAAPDADYIRQSLQQIRTEK